MHIKRATQGPELSFAHSLLSGAHIYILFLFACTKYSAYRPYLQSTYHKRVMQYQITKLQQGPVEPGDALRIGFGHREEVCP